MRALIIAAFTAAAGCTLTAPLDRTFGPGGRTIREEIATWPPERREEFSLLRVRCTKCHTLNEPFAAHVPKGGWRSQIRKMQREPGAAIPDADAKRIASFLEYFADRRRNPPKD